jgi:mono/diheme cytochrome c family protein
VRILKGVVLGLIVVLVLGIGMLSVVVASRQNLKFNVPEPALAASSDSAVIARGRYVVRTVAVCGSCHGATAAKAAQAAGEEVPLSGGYEWRIPPGVIRARNITPDPETGIGRISDGSIARALRHGVGHDGRALLPFMEMQGLSDEDLVAVVSYLRAQPPVRNAVPDHHFNPLGKIIKATVLANPVGPKSSPPARSPRGASVENGGYLAGSVANCWACHTQRNPNTGAMDGALYAGATGFEDPDTPDRLWSPPNITSDAGTGRVGRMNEDQFVARFRAGRIIPGSPMPWQAYARMTEEDLRAMYRFLKTVPTAAREVGPPFVTKK